MANRRRNFRKKGLNILEKENKYFKVVSITLLILLAIVAVIFGYKLYMSYKQKKQIANEQKETENQIESIFKSADDAINNANNYKTNTILRLSIAGVIDANGIEKYANDNYNFWTDIAQYLNNSDFTIANYKIEQSRNENIENVIKQTGINVLNITNNSDEKIDNLYSALNGKGIQTIGNKYEKEDNNNEEGNKSTNSERVNIVNKKGINIAFIGYTTNDDKSRNYFTEKNAKADLEYAKKNASVIIVMMDWKNSIDETTEEQKQQAKFLADNGANLIIGNNQNNIQTMEIVKGENDKDCFVAYSLGNLLSLTSIERNKTGIILEIQILVDKDNNTSLNSVDYVSTYILKDNKQINVLNLKDAISSYEKESANNNISSTNYAKMKNTLERVKKLVNKNN